MIRAGVSRQGDAKAWRDAARRLDAAGVAPEQVAWSLPEETGDLFAGKETPQSELIAPSRMIPRGLLDLTDHLVLHRDRECFALAYRLIWRTRSEPHLMNLATDPDVSRGRSMAGAVRRDMHKMKAFVRFRSCVTDEDGPAADNGVYVAWFEPVHHIVEATAPFFVRRFATMRWSILTPLASAHWNGRTLSIGDGASHGDAPGSDLLEDIWRTYFASIFNPARLKVAAMQAEMPKRYWRNLPEATLIGPLVREARQKTASMIAAPQAAPRVVCRNGRNPVGGSDHPSQQSIGSLTALAKAEAACTRCPLYRDATQAVAGEGPRRARLMFVGEQPGDAEDKAGRPFVGPAGRVFAAALERVGIDRESVFVTNAVKHFKFEPRGKRRLHKRPNAGEIDRCRWWLDLERRLVRPDLIVALGATAARGVLGRAVTISRIRGEILDLEDGSHSLVTIHPAALLRLQDEDRKGSEWRRFVDDLTTARNWLAAH